MRRILGNVIGRIGRFVVAFCGAVILFLALIVVAVEYLDWSWLRPHIAAYTEKNYGFKVDIEGPMRFRLFPDVGVDVKNVRVIDTTNPLKADFFSTQECSLRIKILPLFKGDLVAEEFNLRRSELNMNLEAIAHITALAAKTDEPKKTPAKKTLEGEDDDLVSDWPFPVVENINVQDFIFKYHDGKGAPNLVAVDRLAGQVLMPPEPIILVSAGAAQGAAFRLDFHAGGSLKDEETAYPTKIEFATEGLTIGVNGDIKEVIRNSGASLRLTVNASNVGHVAKAWGKTLKVPPFKLFSRIKHAGRDWLLTDIKASMGQSLVLGEIRYIPRDLKSLIDVKLEAPNIRFVDVQSLLPGAEVKDKRSTPSQHALASKKTVAKSIPTGSDKSPSIGARLSKDRLADIELVLPDVDLRAEIQHIDLPLVKGNSMMSLDAKIRDDALKINSFVARLGVRRGKILSEVKVKGMVGKIPSLLGMNLALSAEGNDLESFAAGLMRLELPDKMPDYNLQSRWRRERNKFSLSQLSLVFGESSLHGSGYVDISKKPMVVANLTSPKITTADFEAFTGDLKGEEKSKPTPVVADPEGDRKEKEAKAKAVAWVLPDKPLDLEILKTFNAALDVKLGQLVGPNETLSLSSADASLRLEDGDLHLLHFSVATKDRGVVAGRSSFLTSTPSPQLSLTLGINALNVGKLAEPATQKMPLEDLRAPDLISAMIGGYADLKTHGRSLKSLAENTNGTLGLYSEKGKLSRLVIEAVGIDITEGLGAFAQNTPSTPLDCLIAVVPVEDGVAKFNDAMLATKDSNVYLDGQFDIVDGRSDLQFHTRPRDFSIGSVRAPINVKGPVTDATPQPDYGIVALKGLAAVGLAVLIHPAALIIPLIEPAPGSKRVCKNQKDVIAAVEYRSKDILGKQEIQVAH